MSSEGVKLHAAVARNLAAGYRVRPMRPDDVPEVVKVCQEYFLDISIPNMRLYLDFFSDGYDVMEDVSGKIVALHGRNRMKNGITFGTAVIVRDDYASGFSGKGLTHSFHSDPTQPPPDMGNATPYNVKRYKIWPIFRHKINGFGGQPNLQILRDQLANVNDISIRRVNSSNLPDIVTYDRLLIPGIDRSKFWREWCLAERFSIETHGFIAYDGSNNIRGWGAARRYPGSLAISPLYADTPQIAKLICLHLLETVGNRHTYFVSPAHNLTMVEVARDTGLKPVATEIRVHNQKPEVKEFHDTLAMEKVFILNESWPV